MRVTIELDLKPAVAVGCDLVALDDREIQNGDFPVLSVGSPDLNITLNKADAGDAVGNLGDIVVGRQSGVVRGSCARAWLCRCVRPS